MTTTHTCPPIEEIAALLDGRLEKQERLRIIQHLDECSECYEVFIGAAQFLEEDSAAEQPLEDWEDWAAALKGRVVKFPPLGPSTAFPLGSSTAVRRWLPLAAAAVLAVAVGLPIYRAFLSPPRIGATDALIEPLEGAPRLQENLWPLETNRGEAETSGSRANSFLIGVYLVDRQIYLGMDDPEGAAALSQRIRNALVDLRMDDVAREFERDWTAPARGIDPQTLLGEMKNSAAARESRLEGEETLLETDYLAFGKWAEAARLAAVTENFEFFEQRDVRRFPSYFLNELLEEDGQDLEAAVRPKLQRVEEILDAGDLHEKDFQELAGLLGKAGNSESPGIIEFFEDKATKAQELEGEPDYGSDEGSGF